MASFLDKLKVKTAVNTRSKRDLSCCHITSADFFQFNVAYARELVPKESISVGLETFSRMEPLVVPTFGRANIKNRAFFVPFRTVFPGWNDFITQSPHIAADASPNSSPFVIISTPLLTQFSFWNFFLRNIESNSLTYAVPVQFPSTAPVSLANWKLQNPNGYDYIISFAPGTPDFLSADGGDWSSWTKLGGYPIRLTSVGRQVMKIMNSLGYVFSPVIADNSKVTEVYKKPNFSALPLLCLAKVYADWFFPNGYSTTLFDNMFKFDLMGNSSSSSVLDLGSTYLNLIFSNILRTSYDPDYFTSAWDQPNAPNAVNLSGVYSLRDINNPSGTGGSVSYPGGHGNVSPTVNSSTFLTKYALDALASLSDYIKRHQLVGARSIDRFLARFGIQLSSDKLCRSIYLGEDIVPLQIGDVMSTADTSLSGPDSPGMPLGSYAGKGIAYGGKTFEHDTDEYGMFIIVSSIIPKVGYYQGFDRTVLHTSPLSFWTPEFDSLGCQAISRAEVYEPIDNLTDSSQKTFYDTTGSVAYYNSVFGYTPRYAEYKISHDRLTGDKRYNSLAVGQDSWHLMRVLNYRSSFDVVHSRNFVTGNLNPDDYVWSDEYLDYFQYDRIFQNIDSNIDHFNIIYQFNVTSWAPMSSLYDNYEWKDHDKGETVHVDVNGPKMN